MGPTASLEVAAGTLTTFPQPNMHYQLLVPPRFTNIIIAIKRLQNIDKDRRKHSSSFFLRHFRVSVTICSVH